MNDTDAAALANDIVETWPLTASKRIWREELHNWTDHDAAHRAYRKLRRHRPGRDMDIATFATAYRKERGDTTTTETPTGCAHCTDGWIPTTYTTHDGHRTYTGVTPCTCTDGRRHNKLHTEIIDARNARQPTEPTAPPPPNLLLDDHTLFNTPEPEPQELRTPRSFFEDGLNQDTSPSTSPPPVGGG